MDIRLGQKKIESPVGRFIIHNEKTVHAQRAVVPQRRRKPERFVANDEEGTDFFFVIRNRTRIEPLDHVPSAAATGASVFTNWPTICI